MQQGQTLRAQIRALREDIRTLDAVKTMKPRLMPVFLFLAMAKRRASKLLAEDIFEYYPRQAQRLKGIAEGAGLDLSTVLFLQSLELLIGRPSFRIQACTSLGFSAERTSMKEVIVAKNFDYLNVAAPYNLTRETRPEGGYRTLGCSMPPLAGMLDGMNEHGLTVTYNLAYTTDRPKYYAPLSLALQEMHETCRRTDEAVRYITGAKRGGHDALLMIADAEGDVRAVEISANHYAVREMTGGQIINTNHYLTEEMRRFEIPGNAVHFGRGVSPELMGTRVHESSERRLERAEELLKDRSLVDEADIASVLRDHGKDNAPSRNTICRHDPYSSTLRSMIFLPERRAIKVLYGNTCKGQYEEFTFT
jgi:predicted choloylglycine hydrolase